MSVLKITCSNDNIYERRYIINTLLSDFLSIDYDLVFDQYCTSYKLEYNNKVIEIKDDFFLMNKKEMSFLSKNNIPNDISFFHYEELDRPLPIIYGENQIITKDNKIVCGLDIFASSFFMLTRWEEYIIKKKNNPGRVDEFELWAVKNKVNDRAIVNEYVEFLKILLSKIDCPIPIKKKSKVMLTHDVDWCHLSSLKKLFQNLKLMILNKRILKKPFLIACRYFYYKIMRTNPFDSFDELMDKSDLYKFKNHFYFKATVDGENGHTYNIDDPRVEKIIGNIIHRGHKIGFHPSENTIDNYDQFKRESHRLKSTLNMRVQGGRNHGLHYNRNMYHYWENEYYEYDSGLGFQYLNGFRSGTCYSYKIFDIYNRETLELREIPFIAMDSVAIRNKLKPQEFYDEVIKLIDTVKRYNGIICLNWHSNMLNMIEMRKYKKLYFEIVDYIGDSYAMEKTWINL